MQVVGSICASIGPIFRAWPSSEKHLLAMFTFYALAGLGEILGGVILFSEAEAVARAAPSLPTPVYLPAGVGIIPGVLCLVAAYMGYKERTMLMRR